MKSITLGEKTVVSDPCYNGYGGEVLSTAPGKWNVSIETSNEGRWGIRVARLRASHESQEHDFDYLKRASNCLGVDSGQMSIYNPDKIDPSQAGDEVTYDRVCELTLGTEQWGTLDDVLVVSSTGYGDGSYSLYTEKNQEGRVVKIEVVFIGDEDYEDYEDFEDYEEDFREEEEEEFH